MIKQYEYENYNTNFDEILADKIDSSTNISDLKINNRTTPFGDGVDR